jgi:hypothetical protein
VLVYYHGGGWVIANKDVYDATPRAPVNLANCVVVSIDDRQGPERTFPAVHVDALAAYEWVRRTRRQSTATRSTLPSAARGGWVAVDYVNYDGVTRDFFGMGAVVDKAKQAEQRVADGLKDAFAK